jgi:mannose-6-phosphate isomerase-like protein (cupin superfamily)
VGYSVVRAEEIEFERRDDGRLSGPVTDAAGLTQSRGRVWHYPPGARGRRHQDHAQEEVFVVIAGTMTMLLGEPAERFEGLGPRSVVAVQPMTPLQVRNDSADEELVLFIYGAPPEQAGADFLPDVD